MVLEWITKSNIIHLSVNKYGPKNKSLLDPIFYWRTDEDYYHLI